MIAASSKVGEAIEQALDLMFVFILGITNKCEVDVRSCLAFLAGVSTECKHAGCPDESALYVQLLKIMRCRIGSQRRYFRSGTECEKRGDFLQAIMPTLKFHDILESNIMI